MKVDVRCEISGGAQLVDAVANESAISHEFVFTKRIASANATESEQKTASGDSGCASRATLTHVDVMNA